MFYFRFLFFIINSSRTLFNSFTVNVGTLMIKAMETILDIANVLKTATLNAKYSICYGLRNFSILVLCWFLCKFFNHLLILLPYPYLYNIEKNKLDLKGHLQKKTPSVTKTYSVCSNHDNKVPCKKWLVIYIFIFWW